MEEIADLIEDYTQRLRRGERPDMQGYIDSHPQLSEEIRDLFPTIAAMEIAKFQMDTALSGLVDLPQTSDLPAKETARINRLGRYEIKGMIAQGGMGTVYEALDPDTMSRVAIKVLPRHLQLDQSGYKRFQREVKLASELSHPAILPILSSGQADLVTHHHQEPQRYEYYAMPLVSGKSLYWLLQQMKKVTRQGDHVFLKAIDIVDVTDDQNAMKEIAWGEYYFTWVIKIGVRLADAMGLAHAQGIVHRDIKPANVLVDFEGRTYIIDFGLATGQSVMEGTKLTRTGDALGTLRYMPPEQYERMIGLNKQEWPLSERLDLTLAKQGDIYSLGITLCELLTLESPFRISDDQFFELTQKPEPVAPQSQLPAIKDDLNTVLLKAIALQPQDRFESMDAFARQLQTCLS